LGDDQSLALLMDDLDDGTAAQQVLVFGVPTNVGFVFSGRGVGV
jgi:hypothetical protein